MSCVCGVMPSAFFSADGPSFSLISTLPVRIGRPPRVRGETASTRINPLAVGNAVSDLVNELLRVLSGMLNSPKQGMSTNDTAKALADRDMLQQLKPKLDKAVEEVIKQGNYDLVLERGAVVDVKPQFDITRKVIERMNQSR